MDVLHLTNNKDLLEFTENLSYKTNFAADKYFPKQKSRALKALIQQLVANGEVPVMAQFHSLDAEARIGDRSNYTELEFKKLPIKEKLNITERILEAFGSGVSDTLKTEVLQFIFDDASNLVSRVLTRMAAANTEVLATGKLVIKENNIDTVIDYNVPVANKVTFTAWSDASHDIVADLDNINAAAKKAGYKITKAICNSSVIGYITKNTALRETLSRAGLLPTSNRVVGVLEEAIGYGFEVNDDVYKTSSNGETKNMYPDNTITFITSSDAGVGAGALGYTPEELAGINASERSYVTLTTYNTEDPVALWTKASALYVPVLRNPNGIFIATINNA